jgi:hypothetical protein
VTSLRGHGVAVDAPAGWDVRITGNGASDGPTTPLADHPERWAVVHVASFPLPADVGSFGGGAVERMRPDDVFVCLVEFDRQSSETALFAAEGVPRALGPEDFDPGALPRAIAGRSGAQRFFRASGRAFCLYAVLGSHRARVGLVPRVNQVLATVAIDP